MYPVLRLMWQLFKYRNAAPLPLTGTHVSRHYCLPWDIDLWMELNNGRTLTLFDLGRIPLAKRAGLIGVIRRKGWGLTIAGASVRYRRRVRMFERIEMRSRVVWWDDKFIYIEQSMWVRDGQSVLQCANHSLYRSAITGKTGNGKTGIIPPETVKAELDSDTARPAQPDWVRAWIEAEAKRPWPPMQEQFAQE